MTTNNTNTPSFAKKIYVDIRRDAKRILATENCRAILVAGSVLGASLIALAIFLSTTVLTASPTLATSENYPLVNGIMFTVAAFFTLFFFPPIYCGLYNAALVSANGEAPTFHDLFKFYSSAKLYSRSIRIFLASSWYIFGLILTLGLSYIVLGVSNEYFPEGSKTFTDFVFSLQYSFTVFGGIVFFARRKFKFIYIPMAVENTDLSLRECSRAYARTGYLPYRMYFSGDTGKTFGLLIASVLTIGILYILYAAPRAVANKTAYYKAIKID
ncbi:MAG: hypothetical protein IIX97_06990 [Clostridia bacterium]|nr:hypothetical protein [Clostridia bacterium]